MRDVAGRTTAARFEPLPLPGIGVRVVARREEARAHELGERPGLEFAVRGHERQGVVHPGPRVAREGEVGGQVEDASRSLRPADGEAHADRTGARRARRVGRAPALRHGEVVEHAGASIDGDLGVDVHHALDRVVPGVAFETAVGLEQALGDGVALGRALEGLGLGRLGVVRHQQRIGADRPEPRRLAPVVDVGEACAPRPELGPAARR